MGWNEGYRTMERTVVSAYDTGSLTPELLDSLMEPYKGTDCDRGGSENLRSRDGLGVEEIICKIMEPEKYEDVIKHLQYDEGETWESSGKTYDLFWEIWNGKWGIW